MVINIRYYVITIVAIFFSIGVGIFIGFNLNSKDIYLNQQKILLESLEERFSELKIEKEYFTSQIEELKLENQRIISFLDEVYGELIQERLKDYNIAIITTSDHYYYNDIRNVLEDAGATVPIEIQITDKVHEYETMVRANGQALIEVKTIEELTNLINIEIERLITQRQESTLLKSLADQGYIKYIYDEGSLAQKPIHQVIMAGGGLVEDNSKLKLVDLALMDRLINDVIPVIGVERNDVSHSYLPYYQKKSIPIIDQINTTMGKISMVLTIASGD